MIDRHIFSLIICIKTHVHKKNLELSYIYLFVIWFSFEKYEIVVNHFGIYIHLFVILIMSLNFKCLLIIKLLIIKIIFSMFLHETLVAKTFDFKLKISPKINTIVMLIKDNYA